MVRRWWDDEVFEKYPSWDECEGSGFFTRPLLTQYFGDTDENGGGGAGAYFKCAKYGIGREVISKMLEGTASKKQRGQIESDCLDRSIRRACERVTD